MLASLLVLLPAFLGTASAAPLPSSPSVQMAASGTVVSAQRRSQVLPRAWSQDVEDPILLIRSEPTLVIDAPLLLARGRNKGKDKGKGKAKAGSGSTSSSTSTSTSKSSSNLPEQSAALHSLVANHAAQTSLLAAHQSLVQAKTLQAIRDRTPEETAQFWKHIKAGHTAAKETLARQDEMRFHAQSATRPYDGTIRKTDPYAAPHRDGRPSAHEYWEAGASGREDEKKA